MTFSSTVPEKSFQVLSPNVTVAAWIGDDPTSTKVRNARLMRKQDLAYGRIPNLMLEIPPYAKQKMIIRAGCQGYDNHHKESVKKPSILARFTIHSRLVTANQYSTQS